ncbi:MAG: endonuclease/exonuclease/phosphatase family protein [Gemmatimonadales bacterium]
MNSVPLAGGCERAIFYGPAPVPAGGVQWITPAEEGDRDDLARWCRTVGPALVAAQSARVESAPVRQFAVVSWNQNVGRGDLRRLVADLQAGALTGGEPVQEFVILLQEAYRAGDEIPVRPPASAPVPAGIRDPDPDGAHREDILTLARSLGLGFFYAPSMRNGREEVGEPREDRGNAILSTMPMEGFRVVTLPHERQRRAAVLATLLVPGHGESEAPIALASLHLDVWPAILPSLLDPSRRNRQAGGFLAAGPAAGSPVILGADLNAISPGDPQVMLFRARWPEWEESAPCHTRGPFCTDYLFTGDMQGWAVSPYRATPESYGSDHLPLVTVLTRVDEVAERR